MFTQKGKTVFIEYSTAEKGQHFMTIIWIDENHKRHIIGRIYREYDKKSKKYNYIAVDWAGNHIFRDVKDISSLKKEFKDNGKNLAMIIPKGQVRNIQSEKEPSERRTERTKELKKTREQKTQVRKNREQSIEKDNVSKNFNEPEYKETENKELNQNNEKSEREAELEQIREQNMENDIEQEQEQEQEQDIDI